MPIESEAIVVFVTVPDEQIAVKLSEALVQQRLAACAHILPPGRSIYLWKGSMESALELTLIIKSRADRFGELEVLVRRLHPYEVPEIVAIPAARVSVPYLNWILDELQ